MIKTKLISDHERNLIEAPNYTPKKNVQEFDLILWKLLQCTGLKNSDVVKNYYDVSSPILAALKRSSEDKIDRIADGIVLSFKPSTSESTIIDCVSHDDDQFYIGSNGHDLELQYWSLYRAIAATNIEYCPLIFGTSRAMSEIISNASLQDIYRLTNMVPLTFRLRCSDSVILKLLTSSEYTFIDRTHKIIQSITRLV